MTGNLRSIGVFALFMLVCISAFAQPRLQAQSGVLDARSWDFDSKRLALSGYWKTIDGKLVQPENIEQEPSSDLFLPSLWNDTRKDGSGIGQCTYVLNVIVPDSLTSWTIEIPQVYSSFKLWVNKKEIGSAGTVSVEDPKPQWVVKTLRFESHDEDTLQFVLQIANNDHYKGGIKDIIYFGTTDRMFHHRAVVYCSNAVETTVLFLLGIAFLALLTLKRRRFVLYFSLLCLTWTVRTIFSNLYPITVFVPDFDWVWMVRIEYLSLYFTITWGVLFLQDLFYKIGSRIFTYTIVILNIFFIVFTLAVPPLIFSQWVSLYLAVAGVVVAYGAFLVIRAVFFEHAGAWFLLGSLMMGIITFGYEIISYQASFSYSIVLNIGYILMFLLITVALLYNLNLIKGGKSNVLTYSDLFDKDQ